MGLLEIEFLSLTCSWLAEASSEAEEHCPGEQVDAGCDPSQKIGSCVDH